VQPTLSRAEELSLQHYLVWTESHGTVKAYNTHAQVLVGAMQEEILSLYRVRKLAEKLAGLKPSFVDMCPKSCMAFKEALGLRPLAHTKAVMNRTTDHSRVLRLNQSQEQLCSSCLLPQLFRHTMPMQRHPVRCAIEIIA
jgi:hypothetical protein